MSKTGLTQIGPVVIVSGPALRSTLDAAIVAIKQRRLTGGMPYSTQPFEDLARALHAAMTADGHSDVRPPAVGNPVPVSQLPEVPLDEAADRLGVSDRQARRHAPKLGGQKINGRWFVDETALAQHIGGTQQQ